VIAAASGSWTTLNSADAVALPLATAARPLGNSYVATGDVAFENPVLTVRVSDVRVGTPGIPQTVAVPAPDVAHLLAVVDIEVLCLRAVPTADNEDGSTPEPAAIEAAALAVLTDKWVLWRALGLAGSSPYLANPVRRYSIRGATSVGPQGGVAGTEFGITLQLT